MVTVVEALRLPEIALGGPRVVAGAPGLDRTIRWVHVAEVADIAELLEGGELISRTGIALPEDSAGPERYVSGSRGGRCERDRRRARAPLLPAPTGDAHGRGAPLPATR